MIIIKKHGESEEYSSEKLSESIRRASRGTGEEIDTNSLAVDFYRIVEGKALIETSQIDVIVCGLLYTLGFPKTLEAFMSYDDKNKD